MMKNGLSCWRPLKKRICESFLPSFFFFFVKTLCCLSILTYVCPIENSWLAAERMKTQGFETSSGTKISRNGDSIVTPWNGLIRSLTNLLQLT